MSVHPALMHLRELWQVRADQPARVSAEIALAQRESEVWVGVAQAVVVCVAALAYFFTPRGFSPDAPIAAAPLGLAALALLVMLRAWFAYTNQLTRPVLAASVIAEMLVLLGILWGFAPQYETTLPVALKNSLYTGVFVLIALRALRFDPAWVWLSGITAALGWSLLAFAAWLDAGPSGRTWDAVTAATSKRMHAGDEAIRVAAILLVTALLALALARARATLTRSVRAAQSADALSRFSIAKSPTRSPRPTSRRWPARACSAMRRSCSPTCAVSPRRRPRCRRPS